MKPLLTITLAIISAIIVSCSPVNPRAELESAIALMNDGKYAQALSKTESCLKFDKNNVDAIILNAQCIYLTTIQPEPRKTVQINLNRAINGLGKKERFDLLYTYAWVLMQEKDFVNAIQVIRNARNVFRAQETSPAVPLNDRCDADDKRLALKNSSYANLLFWYADVCGHNKLGEGLEFFDALAAVPMLSNNPQFLLAKARLEFDCRFFLPARNTLKKAIGLDPQNVNLAWNCALADEELKRPLKKTPEQYKALRDRFKLAYDLACKYNNPVMANKAALKYNSWIPQKSR